MDITLLELVWNCYSDEVDHNAPYYPPFSRVLNRRQVMLNAS